MNKDDVKKFLSYDHESGIFTWIKKYGNRAKIGERAGFLDARGYWVISVFGIRTTAHRVAWVYANGHIPDGMQIDHINGDRSDNRLDNLRVVTRSENQQNRRHSKKGSKTGILGVTIHKNQYRAKIYANGRSIHLGVFDNPELAYIAYVEAKRKLHSTCTI